MDNPLLVLLVVMAFVVVSIVWMRIHAFLALIMAAVLTGLLSSTVLDPASELNPLVQVLRQTAAEFGNTAGNIGIIIVLAAIIGKSLMDSGAADAISRHFVRWIGRDRSPAALLGSGYVLSIPVFFDTVFYLLVPLAKALHVRTSGNYLVYIMAICCGAALTHSLVAPTPGPLIMADNLQLNLGATLLAGLAFSVLPAVLVGWYFNRWWCPRLDVPLRETLGFSLQEIKTIADKPESELPGLFLSLLPIILPVLLIAGATVTQTLDQAARESGADGINPVILNWFQVFGDRNTALFLSMLAAVWLLMRQSSLSLRQLAPMFESAISSAGVIILITSAGGALGAMIRNIGVGDSIRDMVGGNASGVVLILLAFGISSIMKIAQGSTTVAVITASAIMFGVIEHISLPFHPVYLFLAVGFGGLVFSWMNDSGFWIISRMGGLTERETLQSWTVLLALLGIVGLVQILLFSQVLPLV